MTLPEDEPTANIASTQMEGEVVAAEHLEHIKDTWLGTTIENITPLIATDHDLVWEGFNREGEREEVHLPVEHGLDKKKKVIIGATAAVTLAGLGIAVLMRGRFSPKSRKQ